MRIVIFVLLLLPYIVRAEEPTPPVPTQSLEEIKSLLQGMKSKSEQLGKLQNALQQIEADRARAIPVAQEEFDPDSCGKFQGALQTHQCVLHSVREMKKLSDEVE